MGVDVVGVESDFDYFSGFSFDGLCVILILGSWSYR